MFRLLDRYLIREIVPYLLLGLLLLTAIIFAQEASRFSELLVVASRKGLPMETLGRVISALVPGIFVFTLPISLLIGTLVGLQTGGTRRGVRLEFVDICRASENRE